jgi:hypothetical protein
MGFWSIDARANIPAAHSLVILTTNESRQSLVNSNTSETTRVLDVATDSTDTLEDAVLTHVPTQDGTTETSRDRSVLNRFKVIQFPKLSADSSCRIISQAIDKNFAAHKGFAARQGFGELNLSIDANVVNHFIKFTQEVNSSMHVVKKRIEDEISQLISATLNEYSKAKEDITQKHFILYENADGQLKIKHRERRLEDKTSVVLRKPESWLQPYIYAYRTNEDGIEEPVCGILWPGIPMPESDIQGEYHFTLPSELCQQGVRVLFNDGKDGAQIPVQGENGFFLEAGETGILIDNFWKTRLNPQISLPPMARANDQRRVRPVADDIEFQAMQPLIRTKPPKKPWFARLLNPFAHNEDGEELLGPL